MNHVMKVPDVIKRKSAYYFKFNIPADCRHCLDGRTEIQKSLKTEDIFKAKDEAEKLSLIWKEKIAKIREANASADAPVQVAEIKLDTIVDKFRKQIAPYIEKQIHACLAKPDAQMRKTLYLSIENSIDAYQKCIAARTDTDQELINLINPFAKTDEFSLHSCPKRSPAGSASASLPPPCDHTQRNGRSIEMLGEEVLVHITSGQHKYITSINPHESAMIKDDQIQLTPDLSLAHIFDTETGRNLTLPASVKNEIRQNQ